MVSASQIWSCAAFALDYFVFRNAEVGSLLINNENKINPEWK